MESAQPTQSILETLRTVEFRLGLKGYNVDEVDEYLEKAAVEAEAVLEQLRSANERLQHAGERIAQLEVELQRVPAERPTTAEVVVREPTVSDDALQRTLILAQKFVDQTKRESEAEAAEIVSRAEERARSVVAQAEERARQMSTEAEQRLRDEVSRLEGLRNRLASDVDTMGRHLEEQRTRIRASLTEVLKWVDERMQPPAATATGRQRATEQGDDGGPNGARSSGAGRPAPLPERPTEPSAAPEDRVSSAAERRPAAADGQEPSRPEGPRPDRAPAPGGARLRSLDAETTLEELFDSGPRAE